MRLRMPAVVVTVLLTALSGLVLVPAQAGHNADDHSENVILKARQAIVIDKEQNLQARGSDLAFQGNLVIAGSFEGVGIYRILPARKGFLKQIGFLSCPGGQGDVSVWNNIVVMSVDTPKSTSECGAGDATQAEILGMTAWEGVRIIDISEPTRPRQIAAVATDCGSHTNTMAPGTGGNVYVYIESYPLTGQSARCNAETHRKSSVVEIPLSDPAKAKVVGTVDVSPAIGCHDVTVVPRKQLAYAACVTEAQVWDIKDPAAPVVLSHFDNPNVQIFHSTAMTWDDKYLLLGDEYGGAAVSGADGCTGDQNSTQAALWIYDVSKPETPVEVGHYSLPRRPVGADNPDEAQRITCTTHNFNVIPMRDPKKYIAPVSYYMGGMSVVDFSDPANPVEHAHYLPMEGGVAPDMWGSYWYNGRIYSNDFRSRMGVSVFKLQKTSHKAAWYFSGPTNPQTQIASFK